MENLKLTDDERMTLKLRCVAEGYATFEGLMRRLKTEGAVRDDASAIMKARELRADLYNKWCSEGRPAT
jgi:hypothetical protein